ncbi:baseplate J/gp47 family protein [Clostridium magnum]|uniref:baseplate J/gp47 family protein n=1 Tax=Clostridium magnum TaxID=33954 RepID=UPI000910AE79|nr:baseplate J/gp47 family protein [Clostridium magnum]SHJ28142.1 Uncharacterized phage protein gp47/JayE [Clostridium magnum DSM 2767]
MDSGYGITTTGYSKKTYNDLIQQYETRARSQDLFGEEIDFSDQDPHKQLIVPIVEMFAEVWELLEQVFYSASPKYAEGVPLKATGKYIGIAGKQSSNSTGIERFNGSAGTIIPSNYQFGTESGVYFITTESKSIESSGYVDITIKAVEAGSSGNVPANTITKIVSPLIGLSSITNPAETIGGQDEESDVNFRTRYEESTAIGSGSTLDAVKSNLLTITGVEDVIITENETDIEVNGIPPHSFETFVYGGENTAVAQAIFDKKPGGIKAFGDIAIEIIDSQGITHTVGFSRPTSTSIWFKITKTVDANYPSDGDAQIKNAILNYMSNINLGEDIIIYKIISLISNLNLSGLFDIGVQLSTDGINYLNTNITINYDSIAVTTIDKIEVI